MRSTVRLSSHCLTALLPVSRLASTHRTPPSRCAAPARADPLWTQSGARDFYRDQARASGRRVESIPVSTNYFAEGANFPSHELRCVVRLPRLSQCRHSPATLLPIWTAPRLRAATPTHSPLPRGLTPRPLSPHFSQSPTRHPRPRPPRLARLPPRDDGPRGCLDASRGAFRGDRRGHTPREILPAARSPVLLRRPALARRARVRPRTPAVPRDDDARPSSRGANLARAAAVAASASSVDAAALAPRSRTLGTQSDYRESEAQTVPYEPDFVLPERPSTRQAALNAEHHVDGDAPEVLTLRHLRFGDGNPAGDAEATLVQRMRAKRAFEASLPPLSDVARLPLRQRLMEEWEEAEWAEREREIARVQEERLDVLKRAIDAREAEAEALAETRLKRMRAGMLADKHEKFASIQTKRVKHLRKLAARRDRERVPPEGTRAASAADAHANYASTVYAPLSREGGAPRDGPPPYAPDPRRFESGIGTTLGEFAALEASIPRDAFDADAVVDAAKRRDETKKNAEQRRAAVAEALLDATAKNLDEARRVAGGERGVGSCWPAPTDPRGGVAETTRGTTRGDGALESASHAKSRVERPETPELAPPMGGAESASAFAAVVTLQRLIRGVAARREMREGASRRRELIAEILADAETRSEDSDAGKRSDGTLAAEAGAAMAAFLRALSASDDATWDRTDLATRYAEEERLAGAAAKIQARQRGRRARIEARRRRAEVERSSGLPDLDAFDEEETARVVRIQAHVRGRRSRREASFVRNPELRPKKSTEPIPASVSLAEASAKDRASVETMQTSARARASRFSARRRRRWRSPANPVAPRLRRCRRRARARVARLGATRDGRDVIEPMSLGIEPATVAGVGDVPDASRFSDADFAAVAKMQASARRHLDETHRDPAPTEAMPTLDDADAANVKKMQASARALLERRQAERRAAKAEARARE